MDEYRREGEKIDCYLKEKEMEAKKRYKESFYMNSADIFNEVDNFTLNNKKKIMLKIIIMR